MDLQITMTSLDGFSALQRAENSSMFPDFVLGLCNFLFQCSSASRKFLNYARRWEASTRVRFQCSSASRKFLNEMSIALALCAVGGFSALQRAENSSIALMRSSSAHAISVSVLFSEPKIPQFWSKIVGWWDHACFSALQRAENSSMLWLARYCPGV